MDGMVTYVALLLASLVAGVVLGSLLKFSEKGKKYVSRGMTALMFVLILLMGLKTGSDNAVVSNLGVYGLQSLVITIAAIVGSILFAILFEKLIFKDGVK
jgi:uncharacterized membrane protein YbjE (DUF340 family)